MSNLNLNETGVDTTGSVTVEINNATLPRSSEKKLQNNSKLNLCISRLENNEAYCVDNVLNEESQQDYGANVFEGNECEYGEEEDEEDEYGDNEADYALSEQNNEQFSMHDSMNDGYQDGFDITFDNNQNNQNVTLVSSLNENKNKRKRGYKQNSLNKLNDNYLNYAMYEKSDSIQVNCNSFIGELYKKKFGSGGKGTCIKVMVDTIDPETNENKQVEKWMTPIEFEQFSGKSNCRDWKRTIKVGGQSLVTLMENEILVCHAVSCSCAACNKNESLVGPIRPFMRYRRRKKDEILAQNAFKKFLSLKPPTLLQDSLQKIQNNNQNLNSNTSQDSNLAKNNQYKLPPQLFNSTFMDQPDPNQTVSSTLPIVNESINEASQSTSTFNNNNKQIIKNSLENQKDFATCLEEFEESEEQKWIFLEQEADRLNTQAQTLQALIQQTRKHSELNRQVLIKKFFNNV